MSEETPRDWITQIEELLEMTIEAREFVQRASQSFSRAAPEHAVAVARLWQHATALDEQVYGLLDEVNQRLLKGQGEIELTRGASVQPLLAGVVGEEFLFYECTWTLAWDGESHGITVKLSVEPMMESYHVQVASFIPLKPQDIRFPLQEDQLKEALMRAYIAEVTA